ncbi:MAG: hypothetical protein AAB360_01460 [Patescibacteria group bacterium]
MAGFDSDERLKEALAGLESAVRDYGSCLLLLVIPHSGDEAIVFRTSFRELDRQELSDACGEAVSLRHSRTSFLSRLKYWQQAQAVMTAWQRFNDEITSYERATEREYTTILVAGYREDPTLTSVNGVEAVTQGITDLELIENALTRRAA